MAEKARSDETKIQETKIPVLTVLKNGTILKNIFINNHPLRSESESSQEFEKKAEKPVQGEEKLLVGRHPDCHIVLDHPSISRFHVEIRLQHSLQKLFVNDLSSVHGTWVSGKKIDPQVLWELAEGDMLRFGASSRIYRLHWVPVSHLFEIENPLRSQPDIPEEKEETYQDENYTPPIKNKNVSWGTQIPSAPPMPEAMDSSFPEEGGETPTRKEAYIAIHISLERENQSPTRRLEQMDIFSHHPALVAEESLSSSLPAGALLASEGRLERENQSPEGLVAEEVPEGREYTKMELAYFATQRPLDKENCNSPRRKLEWRDESNHHPTPPRMAEYMSPSLPVEFRSMADTQLEMENRSPESSVPKGILSERENHSPPRRGSEQKDMPSIWSRRGKSASFIRVQTGRGLEKMGVSFNAGNEGENQIVNTVVGLGDRGDKLCKVLFSGSDCDEESFASDKENLTPNVQVSLKSKKSKPETMQQELQKSSPNLIIESDLEENMFPSEKENLSPKVSHGSNTKKNIAKNNARFHREVMERRAERVPFQSILVNSISNSKSISVQKDIPKNINSFNHSQTTINKSKSPYSNQSVDQVVHGIGETKRKWNMVVDTSCLLNEESRRSLKLLEGLRGTHLIIPKMVIRELDCLKRRGRWFKKEDEASSILQWIKECMVKTRWWIHVQSSAESMPIAPTPPVSPRSRLSEGSNEFSGGNAAYSVPFSTHGSLMEIVSPTAEDHILECALLFKKIKQDGQLVLLTNDIALKIKAMAEGLICETATEFRESLVNPYSKRFLWVESIPRGPTWSCLDEASLKENHHHCTIRNTTKAVEAAKGLKLILFHTSHYGSMNSVK
ncbi:forkhead-associated (FHA) domain-containing protein [Tasmannia lanceolata]|uniref:forkhead-associated (FHA) domain-containing protein n=1 Tax=Tasmannia lanceolata TaxID=3420 RepID=UPI00406485DC